MVSLLERWTTPFDPDALLSALHPLWGRRLRGVIDGITPVSASGSASSIVIHPGRAWRSHRPGQFVTLGVDVDGVRRHRCYSLTSVPDRPDGCIQITVQAVADGVVSRHLVEHARPGEVVQLTQADGDFTLPDRSPRPLLFLSGGSGITPLMGMLRWLATQSDVPDVVLLHHAPTKDRALFAAELERLATTIPWLQLELVETRLPGGAHLDADRLARVCPDWRDREVYACGPDSLLGFAAQHWTGAGLTERLHVERFTPPSLAIASAPTTADEHTATARFAASGIDVPADRATPLLDVAEHAGLEPASGCRMGICHTCSTHLDAGCVRDLRDGRLVEAGGHVQLCVSAAAGDVTLDC